MATRQWWVSTADNAPPVAHLLSRSPTERAGGPGAIGAALCGEERQTWQPVGTLDEPGQYQTCGTCGDLADRRAAGITQHSQGSLGHVRPVTRPGQDAPDPVLAALYVARYCRDHPNLPGDEASRTAARDLIDMLFLNMQTGQLDPSLRAYRSQRRATRV